MKEHWHPSIRLADIVEKTQAYIDRGLVPLAEVESELGRRIHTMIFEEENESRVSRKMLMAVFVV
jgi:hypothetical protein